MESKIFIYVSLTLIWLSCGRSVSLSNEDYSWMPYKGDEVLIFRSNTGEMDTIFFIRKDTLKGSPDIAASNSQYEIAAIFCKHSDPNAMNNKHEFLKSYFFKIKKNINKKAELVIGLSAKDAHFYRVSRIEVDSLSKVNPQKIKTSNGLYDDVYIIDGEDYLGSFYERSNFVSRLYWSKSNGLIRYDKKNGMYWELVN